MLFFQRYIKGYRCRTIKWSHFLFLRIDSQPLCWPDAYSFHPFSVSFCALIHFPTSTHTRFQTEPMALKRRYDNTHTVGSHFFLIRETQRGCFFFKKIASLVRKFKVTPRSQFFEKHLHRMPLMDMLLLTTSSFRKRNCISKTVCVTTPVKHTHTHALTHLQSTCTCIGCL